MPVVPVVLFWRIFLFAMLCMNTTRARPAEKAIRLTVPNDNYPRLCFVSAQAGLTVPAWIRGVVLARLAELGFLFRDGALAEHDPAADHSDHDGGDSDYAALDEEGHDEFKLPGDRDPEDEEEGEDHEPDPLDNL